MWLDRLTGAHQRQLPQLIESGRYYLLSKGKLPLEQTKSHLLFNKHTANFSGILVDDGSLRCHLSDHIYDFTQPPPDEKRDSATELLHKTLVTLDAEINSRALVSPMMPAKIIDDLIHLSPFEKSLLGVVEHGHLHKISKIPRLDLQYEDQVTDIARARRLAKGALVHLASHSECWQRQTFNGVIPKKVLARFSEDDYNIYENRVYARLLDKIERYLRKRISTLDTLQSTLDRALDFYQSTDIDHRLGVAVCKLWGETFNEDKTSDNEDKTSEASKLLHQTLDQLRHLHKTISSLQRSGLYLLVSRQAQIIGGLHLTNILNHDPHYRHLAILWELLDQEQGNTKLTPLVIFHRNQYLAHAYSHYAGLVLRHALQPYMQGQDEYNWGGRTLCLIQQDMQWTLVSTEVADQSHDHEQPKELLVIVPWLSALDAPVTIQQHHRFIASPALDQYPDEQAFHENRIVLSPLDMYCVERFGQLVDQVLNQELMQSYGKSMTKIPKPVLALIKPPIAALHVNPQTHDMVVREELTPELLKILSDALHKTNAIPQKMALERRNQEIRTLQQCPVCESEVKVHFQSPIGFRANCQSCDTARYLSKQPHQYTFEQKVKGQISFRAFGRRTFRFSSTE